MAVYYPFKGNQKREGGESRVMGLPAGSGCVYLLIKGINKCYISSNSDCIAAEAPRGCTL